MILTLIYLLAKMIRSHFITSMAIDEKIKSCSTMLLSSLFTDGTLNAVDNSELIAILISNETLADVWSIELLG